MKLIVSGFEIKLDDRELEDCRKHVSRIIQDVKQISLDANRPGYFVTFLICMNMISNKTLKELDDEALDLILNQYPELVKESKEDDS